MTNNSQRTPLDTVNKVAKMGIKIKEEMSTPVLWQQFPFYRLRNLKGVLMFWAREG
jgi:hypothetical protein